MKSSFYKWHRILGLTALVPVIFWTLSGLSHPFMSNWFRPFIPNEVFRPLTQQQMKPALSIQQVMDQNHLTELRNFGLVHFNNGTFYQILNRDSTYQYYSAADGKLSPYGDKRYAIYLARYFTQDSVSAIKNVEVQTGFDGQYQPINHLLPVWKISFERPDGMDVYVETSQSRLGTFNNNTRKWMLWLFDEFHTWRFLAALGGESFRIIVLMVVVAIMLLSLMSGITVYALFWKKFKQIQQQRKANGTAQKRFLHRYHRQLGLWVSFVMLTFTVSGAFHLYVKLYNLQPRHAQFEQLIGRRQLALSNLNLPVPDSTIKKVSIAKFNDSVYYQVLNHKKEVLYINTATGAQLTNGDKTFAASLSSFYNNGSNKTSIAKGNIIVTPVKQFDNEYGFINKRLPVQKVHYPNGENWYIETTTAKLAAKVAGIDRAEGLSFIFLHKYFGMSWAGKNIRDVVSMLAALGVLVVSLFGFASFIKNK
ncbi:PepSY-associated transmembrane protein [Mucilaginibacter gracilis]|uniref:PepSY-associated transmembrane protein n=1 Tax=Mucilaginibacter gracilis TaxID=423350 RepID=A0A495J8Q9_9SPHI|nr:PepSY-associated TM helix domain-containing protein [Mucilaginibacter gracilis]RKR85071.1 PepSY-associated transmembrane protein [Mucilaginibacter gracilis]